MNDEQAVLDKFGAFLIQKVRDRAIADWEMLLDGKMKGHQAQQVEEVLAGVDQHALKVIKDLLPNIADTVLHHLLWSVEQADWIELQASDQGLQVNVVEESDGLPGELYTADGWIARFSNYKQIDP